MINLSKSGILLGQSQTSGTEQMTERTNNKTGRFLLTAAASTLLLLGGMGSAQAQSAGDACTQGAGSILHRVDGANSLNLICDGSNWLHFMTASSGTQSVAFGLLTIASGDYSFATGALSDATGARSFAGGDDTTAGGYASFSMGTGTNASGFASAAFGTDTISSGSRSFAAGRDHVTSGSNSFAAGRGNVSVGTNSATLGYFTHAGSYSEMSLGYFSETTSGHAFNAVATDVLFEIGNGADDSNRNNAVTVLKNGNTTIDGDLTVTGNIAGALGLTFPLDVEGETTLMEIGTGNIPVLGYNAAADSVFLGENAGNAHTTGQRNTFLGTDTGFANTTGSFNTYVGIAAGYGATTASQNVFVGNLAGGSNTTAGDNVFVGAESGRNNTTGTQNVFIGRSSGRANTTAGSNVFVGYHAGIANSTGLFNTFVGSESGINNTTGQNNSFFGEVSGLDNTTGYENAFFAVGSGQANTTGFLNTYIGAAAGHKATTANRNSFLGNRAGFETTTGGDNTFLGYRAGDNSTTGHYNIVIGSEVDLMTPDAFAAPTESYHLNIGNVIYGDMVDNDPVTQTADIVIAGNLNIQGTCTGCGGSSVFELDSGVVRNTGAHATEDFVFGGPALDNQFGNDDNIRFFFDKSRGAFRAGELLSNSDESQLGFYSASFGQNNLVSGQSAFSVGYNNTASGLQAVAFGTGSDATGNRSFAVGNNVTAAGNSSTAMGFAANASGLYSISLGTYTTASAERSTAIGNGPIAAAHSSTALGLATHAGSYAETSLGIYSINSTGNATTWVGTDTLFEIGNGTAPAARNNALTVLKNGNTTIDVSSGEFQLTSSTSLNKGYDVNQDALNASNTASALTLSIDSGLDTNGDPLSNTTADIYFDGGLNIVNNALDVNGDGLSIALGAGGRNSDLIINGNGDITAEENLAVRGNISYVGTLTDISDRRLKTGIIDLTQTESDVPSILNRLAKVKTYSFVMKDDEAKEREVGVMAQEVESDFPLLVQTADDEMKTKSVNYIGFIPYIIEGIKDLFDRDTAMQIEIDALKAQNELLIKRLEALETSR